MGSTLRDRREGRERRAHSSGDRRNRGRDRRSAMQEEFDGPERRQSDRRVRARRTDPNASAILEATGQTRKKKRSRFGGSRRLENLAMFARQLYVLVSCGTPVVQALQALERQTKDESWRDTLRALRLKVEEGDTLAEAMAPHPRSFDAVTRTLVAAGETSGALNEMLDRIASLTEQRLQIRRAVVGALMYPIILLFVAVGAFVTMMMLVLPKFAGLFETLDMPLPPTTKILVSLSESMVSYWWAAILAIVATCFVVPMIFKSEAGRKKFDHAVLAMPKVGKIVRSFTMARISRLLGVLIQSHVPMLDAIALTRGATSNGRYKKLLEDTEDIVRKGESLSTAFSNTDLIAPSTAEAIRSGEQAGQVGTLLLNIADFADGDNETIVKSLTSIIEPFVLIILGLMIGIVAISLFLPLFDLTAMTQGG